jgi:hypothetical protein
MIRNGFPQLSGLQHKEEQQNSVSQLAACRQEQTLGDGLFLRLQAKE